MKYPSSSSGFTLLEVLISLSVAVMVGVTLFSGFNYYLNLLQQEDFEFTSFFLAQGVLQDWKTKTLQRKEGNFSAYSGYKYSVEKVDLWQTIRVVKVHIQKKGETYSVSSYELQK